MSTDDLLAELVQKLNEQTAIQPPAAPDRFERPAPPALHVLPAAQPPTVEEDDRTQRILTQWGERPDERERLRRERAAYLYQYVDGASRTIKGGG